MCYHTSSPSPEKLQEWIGGEFTMIGYTPYYHVSGFVHPELPVMTMGDPHKVQPAKWGLVPFWSKDEADAKKNMKITLNATCEKMWTTPMFRTYAPKQRCLVFTEGFYEWRWDDEKGTTKVPHFIYMPGKEPFAFGGLYSEWADRETGEMKPTVSIVTTSANELMATIHNNKKRMPLILDKDKWDTWLYPEATREEVQALTVPYPEGILCAHEISKNITNRNYYTNVPEIQEEVHNGEANDRLF